VILALALGAAFGLAVASFLYALVPAPPPLHRALAALGRPARPRSAEGAGATTLLRVARVAGAERHIGARVQKDLAITGHDEAWYLTWCTALGVAGLVTGPVLALVSLAAAADLPWAIPVLFSLILGPLGVVAGVLSLRAEATKRRSDFGFALSAWLDLVVISMAAGRGTEGALVLASESGSGFSFEELRKALSASRLRGVAPWDALDELGSALGVDELCGIASSVRLAGSSGARVRASLAARAKALRERGLAEARAASESATERMSIPVVALVVGFIVLIGWPAIEQITTKL